MWNIVFASMHPTKKEKNALFNKPESYSCRCHLPFVFPLSYRIYYMHNKYRIRYTKEALEKKKKSTSATEANMLYYGRLNEIHTYRRCLILPYCHALHLCVSVVRKRNCILPIIKNRYKISSNLKLFVNSTSIWCVRKHKVRRNMEKNERERGRSGERGKEEEEERVK